MDTSSTISVCVFRHRSSVSGRRTRRINWSISWSVLVPHPAHAWRVVPPSTDAANAVVAQTDVVALGRALISVLINKLFPVPPDPGEEAGLVLINDGIEDSLLFRRKRRQVLKRPLPLLPVRVPEDVFPDGRYFLHVSIGWLQRCHNPLLAPQMTDNGAGYVREPLAPSSTLDRNVQLQLLRRPGRLDAS
jgi:hypothetical protein